MPDRVPERSATATPWYGSDRRLLIAAVVVTALPLAVAFGQVLVERGFALHGDGALIELRVRDVGSDTPLVGSYQRFGWNQPGPLLFYLLAVPYRMLGSTFAGLEVGALVLNAAAVAGIGVIAFRRGGAVLLLWSLTLVAVLVHGLGAEAADPWEPRVIVLLTVLLLFLAFDALEGGAWSLPVAALVASLLAQAYAGVAPLAVALLATALVGVVWRAHGPSGAQLRARLRPIVLVTVAVLALAWMLPLIEQLTGDPGNVTEMWRFFRSSPETLGLSDAASAVALQLGHRAPWLGGDVPLLFGGTVDRDAAPLVPWGLLALGAGLTVAARRRDRSVALAVVALVTVIVSTAALSRLVGDVFPWILGWTSVVGLACWLAAGWCGYCALSGPARARIEGPLIAVLTVALIAVSAVSTADAASRSYERDRFIDAMVDLGNEGLAVIEDVDGPVLVEVDPIPLGGGDAGPELLVLALERAGIDPVVDRSLENRFGDHRARPDDAVLELRVVTGGRDAVPPGYGFVATVDPLSRHDRQRRQDLEAELERLDASGSLPEIEAAADRDPRVRRVLEQLGEIEDLPRLTLAVRERGQSGPRS